MATKDDGIDIGALQTSLTSSGATWTAAENPVTALAPAARKILLGASPPEGAPTLDELEQQASASAEAYGAEAGAPSSVNLTDYTKPIRNQGSCGSCVSFGTIATIEGTARVNAKDPSLAIDLSEAHLFYGHGKADGATCRTGWWPDPALDAVRDNGIVDEACCPYTPGDQALHLCADADQRLFKITSWKTMGSTAEMKTWLSTKGPLVGCFKVYNDFFAYRSGVYHRTTDAAAGGHCISIVGYDDNVRAWIAKNSWGTGWGEQGFFKIAYGECGIDAQMWGVELPKQEHDLWLKRKQVTGTWVVAEQRNAAAYLSGAGWKAIGGANDADFQALLSNLQSAREAGSQVDVRLVNDRIVEVYAF